MVAIFFLPVFNFNFCPTESQNIQIQIRNTGTFTSFFKDKKSEKSQNSTTYGTVEIKVFVFLSIFAWFWKDLEPEQYLCLMDPDANPAGQKT